MNRQPQGAGVLAAMIGGDVLYKDLSRLGGFPVEDLFRVWSKTSYGLPRGRRKAGEEATPADDCTTHQDGHGVLPPPGEHDVPE